MSTPTLILSSRHTTDDQRLWRAAVMDNDWQIERLRNWRIPEEFKSIERPVIYMESLFAPILEEGLGVKLLEPPPDWLTKLPEDYLGREVWAGTLEEARNLSVPTFVKPPNDKSFKAGIYHNGAEFQKQVFWGDDNPNQMVLFSEIRFWEYEFRLFVLDRRIEADSLYMRFCRPADEYEMTEAREDRTEQYAVLDFAEELLDNDTIEWPKAFVMDVGKIEGGDLAVVELNAAWASGIYDCSPTGVLRVLEHCCEKVKHG